MSAMRIYRSNPMNAVGRLPTAPRALAFAVAVAMGLGALGVWAERTTQAKGVANVRAALAAEGRPAAAVEAVGKGGCGRARRLYTWTSGTASGTACAGPGDRVELRGPT